MDTGGPSEDEGQRVDLYLSGGGFRAALGALGVLHFLSTEGLWGSVRNVVSVSGGGFVNARLAISRPSSDHIGDEIRFLYQWMTDARMSRLAFWQGLGSIVGGAIAVGVLLWLVIDLSALQLVLALVGATVLLLPLGIRVWLSIRFRTLLGKARLGDLAATDWPTQHILVSTDLSHHGSFFFVSNSLQSVACSGQVGQLDAREVEFRQALRASTAFPPVLPPVRFRLARGPAGVSRPSTRGASPEIAHVDGREWIHKPKPNTPRAVWLADGGITGNLGIQFDSQLSPDNIDLATLTDSSVLAGSPTAPQPNHCPIHGELPAWMCAECKRRTMVVDASGSAPRHSRLFKFSLHVPVVGLFSYAVRALRLSYESSLVDDQDLAGDALVGVVRVEHMIRRLVLRNHPVRDSASAVQAMVESGVRKVFAERLLDPTSRAALLGPTRLLHTCYEAREAAATMRTSLFASRPKQAALVVASGFLNACLNEHGPNGFEIADRGMRDLDRLLGEHCGLGDWWAGFSDPDEAPFESNS